MPKRPKDRGPRRRAPPLGAWSAVAAVTGHPDARHVADDARRKLDPSHAIGPGLRIVEGLVLRVDRDTDRQRHACLRRRLAVPRAAGFPVARKGLDDADGYDAAVHRLPLTSICDLMPSAAPTAARWEAAARLQAGSPASRQARPAAGSAFVARWPPLRWRPLHAPTS